MDQFQIALQAYQEVIKELQSANASTGKVAGLDQQGAYPEALRPLRASLRLGIASDGLPILLDLNDPSAGPLLLIGDEGCGKTHFLQSLANSVMLDRETRPIHLCIITPHPEEWSSFAEDPRAISIVPTNHPSLADLLHALTNLNGIQGQPPVILLFIDGLFLLLNSGFEVQYHIHWLLRFGPRRHIWPIAAINAAHALRSAGRLEAFRTRIFGFIRQPQLARALTQDPNHILDTLSPSCRYAIQIPDGWLRFQLSGDHPSQGARA